MLVGTSYQIYPCENSFYCLFHFALAASFSCLPNFSIVGSHVPGMFRVRIDFSDHYHKPIPITFRGDLIRDLCPVVLSVSHWTVKLINKKTLATVHKTWKQGHWQSI